MKERIFTKFRPLSLALMSLMVAASIPLFEVSAEARTKRKVTVTHRHTTTTTAARSKRGISTRATSSRKGTRGVVTYSGSRRRVVAVPRSTRSSRTAHSGRRGPIKIVRQAKPKYAYPLSLFLMHAPSFDKSPLDQQTSEKIARAFDRGVADNYPARTLVRAGVVAYHPLRGGIYYRREPVKYIILHSTETGPPVRAINVIEGWSSMGRRHPGAQYVVERDGTIYQCVDPDLATVHVNIFKTLPGINNDNSIGIEMNHTGRQDYPQAQREAVSKLLAYLQQRYQVDNADVITHRYAQQGDHTDPVHFDLDGFLAYKNNFQRRAIAYKTKGLEQEVKTWTAPEPAAASTILQPHAQVEITERKETIQVESVRPTSTGTGAVVKTYSTEQTTQETRTHKNLDLRGPIEVDPSSASDLNQNRDFEVDGPGATATGAKVESKSETKIETKVETKTETKTETKSDSKPDNNSDSDKPKTESRVHKPRFAPGPDTVSAAPRAISARPPAQPTTVRYTPPTAKPVQVETVTHTVTTNVEKPEATERKSVFQRMRKFFREAANP